jgi:hypothetical protein
MFRHRCPMTSIKKIRKKLIGPAMTPKVEQVKTGTCGCGRSPTGNCIGWHALSEEAFRHQQMLWMEEELRRDNEVDSLK